MTANLCTSCRAPLGDQATLCRDCQDGLVEQLQHVRWLLRELRVTATGQDVLSLPDGPSSGDKPLPFKAHASAVFDGLRNSVQTWARVYGFEVGHPDTHLLSVMAVIRMSDMAGEMVDDLDVRWRRGLQVINRPEERTYLGTCSTIVEGRMCTAELYVRPKAPQHRCRECRTLHDVAARREVLLSRSQDYLGTATFLAAALAGLMNGEAARIRKSIYNWHHRGRLLSHGKDAKGDPLFRTGDVTDLLIETQTRANTDSDEPRDTPQDAA